MESSFMEVDSQKPPVGGRTSAGTIGLHDHLRPELGRRQLAMPLRRHSRAGKPALSLRLSAPWHARRPCSTIENSSFEGNLSCSAAYSGLSLLLLALSAPAPGRRRSRHAAHPRGHAAYDLQLRRHHHGPRAPPADRERRRQPHPVLLGQYAHRPDLHRVPHPRQAGQGRSGRYHLPRRPQRRPAMEHQEPDRRQDPGRDPVFYVAASPGPPITWASPTRTKRS